MGVARRAGAAAPDLRTLARLGRLVTASLGTDAVLIAVLALVGKARFPVRHREMLELFAAQAAVAIVNARLYADSNARREAAEALAEVGRLLSQTLDPVIVARRITEHVCRLLDARSAAVYRPEHDTGMLVVDTVFETDRPFVWQPRLDRGTGVAGLALATRAACATPDVVADPRLTY